ncbi:heavy-metal-associated domain-containing protein [Microbacterium sp.]|uniref:heavy-metal-associated domain-containing protein n=1 Tax=Microbacterium sp. TaxID=51671 RepID=UPI003C79228C
MTTSTYTVQGMTCAHCAGAVSREVRKITGVDDVAVDVSTGGLTVTATATPAEADVAAAVAEAGYTLVVAP